MKKTSSKSIRDSQSRGTGERKGSKSKAGAQSERIFPVVGIGASAGGLEAYKRFFHALPEDTGMAFVLVQHLHPDYASALAEILGRETRMPVAEIQDGVILEPNHVYVIPPNAELDLMRGKLHLTPRAEREHRMPIDHFFRSMAADRGGRTIGIILSGTASDGVLGLKAIKGEGGITFAQDEATAKYGGLPHSAISAGVVDFVLSPEEIARELAQLAQHPYVSRTQPEKAEADKTVPTDALEKIFMLLRSHTGHDFTNYKRSTIVRRVIRRMLLHKIEDMDGYANHLESHPTEVKELFHDILINVTAFFRDPSAFQALSEKVFPKITKQNEDRPIRVWVPGCSTGEEAYSIAIALLDYLGDRAEDRSVLVFATDIDEMAIEKARAGVYPESIIQDVTPEHIKRYFTQVEGGYQVSRRVRETCIFALQDLTKDPPFSRIDLISCRNLLIYLGPGLQKKALRIFHYALSPDGFLFMGAAESTSAAADLFRAVDIKGKIYARKSVPTPRELFGLPVEVPVAHSEQLPAPRRTGYEVDIEQEADRLLMQQYVPAGVIINTHMDILHFRGKTGPYLEPRPGEASFNLIKMVRQELVVALSAAVREAIRNNKASHRAGITLHDGDKIRYVDLDVLPIASSALPEPYFLVVFQDARLPQYVTEEQQPHQGEKGSEVLRLEEELTATKEYLQSVIEQHETTNEELRSANEEIQSNNEELQSINEELETAKEELQSTNEELSTVNEELLGRTQELEQANNDLTNLVTSVEIPIVIVGSDRHIRMFTPQAKKLMNLISSDVGRPIFDIKPNVEIPDFQQLVIDVIENIKSVQREVVGPDHHWYSLRIKPYRTGDNQIEGAVIALIDVDDLKRSLDETKQAREYSEAIIRAIRHPLLVMDRDLRVVSASRSYMSRFQTTEEETLGNLVNRIGNGQWAIPELRSKLEKTVTQGVEFNDFVVTHDFPRIGNRTMRVSGRQVHPSQEHEPMVLMQIEEVEEDFHQSE